MFSVNFVTEDNWNYGTNADAGVVGFGKNSPVWNILGTPATKQYDVFLTPFTDWSWAQAGYTPTTTQSIMTVGGYASGGAKAGSGTTTISPSTSGGTLFELESIGFGLTKSDNSAYYTSILNDNPDFGNNQNKATLSLGFRGLGLPTQQYDTFVELLSVITHGEASCIRGKGGYCVLADTCDTYNSMGLWQYDFKIRFVTDQDTNYIRVPLSTFANNTLPGAAGQFPGFCVIFVEYLMETNADSQQIIFGGMFFQSIYAQYNLFGVSGVNVALSVNANALSNTFITNIATTQGTSPFTVR